MVIKKPKHHQLALWKSNHNHRLSRFGLTFFSLCWNDLAGFDYNQQEENVGKKAFKSEKNARRETHSHALQAPS